MTRRLVGLPLDARPVNTRDPALLAQLAGGRLELPPSGLLGGFDRPGDPDRLLDWLEARLSGAGSDPAGGGFAGVVAALDMVAFGGLIASRTRATPIGIARARIERLARLCSRITLHASTSLLRQSITVTGGDAVEAWRIFHHVFGLPASDRARALPGLEARFGADRVGAYLACRRRNLEVNRFALDLAAAGRIANLLVLKEDCTPGGILAEEEGELRAQAGPGRDGAERVSFQVGTDEGGMMLVARAMAATGPRRLDVTWGTPGLHRWVAPYEDRSVGRSLVEKARWLGMDVREETRDGEREGERGRRGDRKGDGKREGEPNRGTAGSMERGGDGDRARWRVRLYVHGEVGGSGDLAFARAGAEPLPGSLDDIEVLAARGPLALADLRHANGGDPTLLGLASRTRTQLVAYAGWNTASNTLGTVLAHLACAGRCDPRVQARFLALRWLEDLVYMGMIRPQLREELTGAGVDPQAYRRGRARARSMLVGHQGRVEAAWADMLDGGGCFRTWCGPVRVTGARPRIRNPWPRAFEAEVRLGGRWERPVRAGSGRGRW